jgi:hypothetical protein
MHHNQEAWQPQGETGANLGLEVGKDQKSSLTGQDREDPGGLAQLGVGG